MTAEALVYVDLDGAPHLAGRLWARLRKGRDSATFEYDKDWLASPVRFSLEPALQLGPGPFHTSANKPLFGAIGDSAPDRWGRVLMRRAERRRAEKAGETPRTLREIDYLLMVNARGPTGRVAFCRRARRAVSCGGRCGAEERYAHALAAHRLQRADSNTDDHLRNHGFLYLGPDGWRLAPAYDVNPVPADIKPRILTTTIDLDDGTASLDLALEVAEYFELVAADTCAIAAEVGQAVADWRNAAAAVGLTPTEINRMASAFDHQDLQAALALR